MIYRKLVHAGLIYSFIIAEGKKWRRGSCEFELISNPVEQIFNSRELEFDELEFIRSCSDPTWNGQVFGVFVPSQDHAGTHTVHQCIYREFNHTALLIEISYRVLYYNNELQQSGWRPSHEITNED